MYDVFIIILQVLCIKMAVATLTRLGLYGVVVWLLVGVLITLISVGEYLNRPPAQQSFWKAGVTVSIFRTRVIYH